MPQFVRISAEQCGLHPRCGAVCHCSLLRSAVGGPDCLATGPAGTTRYSAARALPRIAGGGAASFASSSGGDRPPVAAAGVRMAAASRRISDGRIVRQLLLRSVGAAELAVQLRDFALPPGDSLLVYSPERSNSPVVYTGKGPLQMRDFSTIPMPRRSPGTGVAFTRRSAMR